MPSQDAPTLPTTRTSRKSGLKFSIGVYELLRGELIYCGKGFSGQNIENEMNFVARTVVQSDSSPT